MDKVIERIFELMQNMPSTDEGAVKAWVLGQIAAILTQGEADVWYIRGETGTSIEVIEELLVELEVSHDQITFQEGMYVIPLK